MALGGFRIEHSTAIAATVVAIAFIVAASMYFGWGKDTTNMVRIGTLRGGVSTLDVITRLGLDQKYGLDVRVEYFTKTLDLANALARGDIDVAVIPAEFVAKLREHGDDAVIIAVDFYQNQAIVAKPEAGINRIEDLVGRRVGVFKPTGTYAMFKAYMKAGFGIDVEKSLQLVDSPPPQLVQAFARSDVDAVVLWEPFVSKLVVDGGGEILATYDELWDMWSGHVGEKGVMIVYAARGSWARDNPGIIEALQRIRAEAAQQWNRDKALAVQILMEEYGLSEGAAELCWQRVKMEESVTLTEAIVENILAVWELAREGGYISSEPAALARGAFWRAG
ncbi:MAG TPA: hypothetical protein EYP33_06955 [Pyrodictium sp.]|nr:hypothetical protein [Pyrodictium sp.]